MPLYMAVPAVAFLYMGVNCPKFTMIFEDEQVIEKTAWHTPFVAQPTHTPRQECDGIEVAENGSKALRNLDLSLRLLNNKAD